VNDVVFFRVVAIILTGLFIGLQGVAAQQDPPNVLFIFGDQWRAQATGYAGDPNLRGKTPNLDALAKEGVNFTHAVSGMPVCTPFRASLMTGQYAQTHGLFLNDVQLPDEALTIAEVYKAAGYDTGFIGKWHLDGHGRRMPIPEERHQGFDYWKVLECTHDYNNSFYYDEGDPTPKNWGDYDAFGQTRDAQDYMKARVAAKKPFALFLAWGPPHNPYQTAPPEFQAMFDRDEIQLRPNVREKEAEHRKQLAGYYAHIAALDKSMGDLLATLDELGVAEDTIVVFTSDHGDMIGSQGERRKQRPWDESIRVPFLLRYPKAHGKTGREITMPLNSPDIMPTLLGLGGIAIPEVVEGRNLAPVIRGVAEPGDEGTLIACLAPFGEYTRAQGGREYRGIRTKRYTYVRSLEGPWLLYDNETDPYQMDNLVRKAAHQALQARLEKELQQLLDVRGDKFLQGDAYVKQFGHVVNPKTGTVPYTNDLPAR
jgi:arylsulfatase A-like enzyme